MKKIFYSIIVAGLALVSAACQKLDEQKIAPDSSNNLTVTASIVNFDGTRVSYAFSDPTNVKSGIKPSWVVGDAIFGFDEAGTTFTFTVSSVGEDGKATFDASSATGLSGKLYAVYYPGKTINDIDNKTIAVDLSSQSGKLDGSAPVIMCATGEIKDNVVNFAFTNQTAIVGIYKMQVFNDGEPVGADKTVTAVTLNGARAKGEIKVEGGVLTLVPGTEDPEGITASGLSLTTDTESSVNVAADDIAPYFAVIPDDNASLSIDAVCDGSSCKTNAAITGKINAGQYYYLGKKVYGGTVATIGLDQQFATISEAFEAANNGDEIQLQNDCTFDSQITLAGKTGTIYLDLYGHTLTNGPTLNGKQSRIYLNEENATLVIRDSQTGGKIVGRAPDQDVVKVIKGNLTVASGTIEAPSGGTAGGNAAIWVEPATSGATTDASVTIQGTANIQGPASFADGVKEKRAYALYVDNPGAAITVSGGTFSAQSNSMRIMDAKSVDITGGTFVCDNAEFAMRFAVTAGKTYTCNISGDATSVTSKSRAVYAYGEGLTLNISGGKFKTTGTGAIILAETGEGANLPVMNITGGLYSKAPNSDYVAENYVCLNNTDPVTKEEYTKQVKEFSAVATLTVGSGQAQEFASVEDAVAEANKEENKETACTITLTAPSTVGAQAVISNTAGVTLDLNDQTLTFGGTDRIYVAKNSSLTIVDNGTNKTGTITQNAKGSNTISLTNEGSSLTISGGKITCAEGQTAITVYITDGTLVMNGGEITGIEKTGISMASDEGSNPVVTISGNAKVTGVNNAISASAGTLTITGGYFAGTGTGTSGYAAVYKSNTSTATVEISGGYYSKAPVEGLVKTGYVCVANDDEDTKTSYPSKVVEITDVAKLTVVGGESTNYTSIEAAIDGANDAQASCTIELLESVTMGNSPKNISNSHGVTLDLKGKTLTQNGSARFGVTTNGKLTIKNGTVAQISGDSYTIKLDDGNMTIEEDAVIESASTPNYTTVYVTGGELTMNAGVITSNAKVGMSIAGGTVNISNGSVSGVNNAISASAGTLTITGGYFAGTGTGTSGYAAVYKSNTSTATVEISGGYYSKAPVEELLKTNHECADNTDTDTKSKYPVKVVEASGVVTLKIGSGAAKLYSSVEAAVTEANKEENKNTPCTITLIASSTVGATATVTNTAGVTLNLNGFTLTHVGSNRIGVKGSGKLIIDDTNADNEGMIIQTTKSSSTITYSAGELIVNGGTITHSTGSTYSTLNLTGGTLTVNGGTISNNAGSSTTTVNTAAVNLSGTSTSVTINGGTIESSGWRALHTTGGTVTMTGGTITSSAAYSAIGIAGGSMTIDEAEGKTVTISAPEMPSSSATVGVVRLTSGSLTLNAGTIGKANGNGDNGNFTALDIEGGTFTMTGGFVVARRFPIYFRTAGSATISGGQLRNSYSGYNAIRFNTSATSTLTLQGDAHLCTLSNATLTGTLFGTASGTSGNKIVPSNASVTINGGYYYVSPEGYTNVTINGAVTTGSWLYDGRTYKYKVE